MTYAARSNACLLAVALGTICMVAGFGLLFVNLALGIACAFSGMLAIVAGFMGKALLLLWEK